MKITKRQLKRIIREERGKLLKEASEEHAYNHAHGAVQELIQELAETWSDGQLGDAAYDAKMGGDTALHFILSSAADRARKLGRMSR